MATIRRRGRRWQAIVRRKGHRLHAYTHDKRAVVERWARDLEREIDAGQYNDTRPADSATLADQLDRYVREITPTKADSSAVPEASRAKTWKRLIGHRTLGALTPDDVVNAVEKRLSESASSDAIRRELQLLSETVEAARSLWGLHLPINPVPEARRRLTKLRRLKPGRRRERRLTHGECGALAGRHCARPTRITRAALLAIETGLRRGELAAVRWEYVDWDACTLDVPASKTDWKTGERGRVVPLSTVALWILEEICPGEDAEGLILGGRADTITQGIERLCKSLNIDDLTLHDLRHEATSRFFERGFSIEEVAAVTGHKDWRSLKRYTHPDPADLARRLSDAPGS